MTGGFVYVLKDASGRHKIGSSRDPIKRIAQLQTGCAETLDFAFVGVAPEGAYIRIERAAHDLLRDQKIPGVGDEWFAVPASIAIGAVIEVSQRLGDPIQQVSPGMVPEIVRQASLPSPTAPRRGGMLLKWMAGSALCLSIILIAILALTRF